MLTEISLNLRSYQQDCIDRIKAQYDEGITRQLVSAATGAGKTVIFSALIRDRCTRTLVIAHTHELLRQAREKLAMIAPELRCGIVDGSSKEFDSPVVLATIQSARIDCNLEELKRQGFELCIYDECHRAACPTAREVLNELGFGKGTEKLLVGFSATPFREDGAGLGEVFDEIVYEKGIKSLIEEGYLCRPNGIKVAADIDLSLVKSSDGDFQAESLAQVMDVPEIRQLVVDSYLKEGEGRQAICFGVNVQNAFNLSAQFRQQGISSKAIHGRTPKDDREAILREYKTGAIQVLCNCLVLTEGFDAPETGCVIIARPTQSRALYQQMAGRGLRKWPGKEDCKIIDFCTSNHTLCSTAVLLDDAKLLGQEDEDKTERERVKEIRKSLPANLNQNLKAALVQFDPLGNSYTWERNERGVYVLRGANRRIGIVPTGDDRYDVIVIIDDKQKFTIASALDFEYAFGAAEDYARANQPAFAMVDREAEWRDLAASDKQKEFIRRQGYKAGIEDLRRGQAADLIQHLINHKGKNAAPKSGLMGLHREYNSNHN